MFLKKSVECLIQLRRGNYIENGHHSLGRIYGKDENTQETTQKDSEQTKLLIKSNKEIAPESSGASRINFPYSFLLKTIGRLLPRAPEPLGSISLTVFYWKQWGDCSRELRSLSDQFPFNLVFKEKRWVAALFSCGEETT